MNRRAVFLDKDGTLVVDVPYNVDPALIRLAPGAAEGLDEALDDLLDIKIDMGTDTARAHRAGSDAGLAAADRIAPDLARRAGDVVPALRIVDPAAVHPLLERLGARPADPDSLLADPGLVAEIDGPTAVPSADAPSDLGELALDPWVLVRGLREDVDVA